MKSEDFKSKVKDDGHLDSMKGNHKKDEISLPPPVFLNHLSSW